MPQLFALGGFLGSELYFDSDFRHLLWVNYNQLMSGEIGALRLAANGIDPGPPDGRALEYGSPLPDYWFETLKLLLDQLSSRGYQLFTVGWDWRKDFMVAGDRLAATIRESVTTDDPCTILAHSMGGLVARRAWQVLQSVGSSGLVRRLITLGSPHQGSYSAVLAASGQADYFEQLRFLSNLGASIENRILLAPLHAAWSSEQLRDLALTWPSLYALFPLLGGTDAAGDPDRALLFERTSWPSSTPISQAHLEHARDVVGPWLRSPATLPPASVLTTVAGDGAPSRWGLRFPADLGRPAAIGNTQGGDGIVTVRSALVPDSASWTINALHGDLPLTLAQTGDLARMVLDERGGGSPPPPPVVTGNQLVPILAGPPIPNPMGGSPINAACLYRRCRC